MDAKTESQKKTHVLVTCNVLLRSCTCGVCPQVCTWSVSSTTCLHVYGLTFLSLKRQHTQSRKQGGGGDDGNKPDKVTDKRGGRERRDWGRRCRCIKKERDKERQRVNRERGGKNWKLEVGRWCKFVTEGEINKETATGSRGEWWVEREGDKLRVRVAGIINMHRRKALHI